MSLLAPAPVDPRTLPATDGTQRFGVPAFFRVAPLTAFWLLIIGILVLPILMFLLVAFSPRLLSQGPEWFTLNAFRDAFAGTLLQGLRNTMIVGVSAAALAAGTGFGVSWAVLRTNIPGRRVWSASMYALLLAPSYLIALGWERLLEPAGVLDTLGVAPGVSRTVLYGPVGVIGILTVKGIPFAYLAISTALRGLGSDFESAARVHGGGRVAVVRMVMALLAPAMWSAVAIVFAESISDFGVAATLANDAHFPVATFTLYNAIGTFPGRFPVAAAVGWMLMAMAGLALLAQSKALRGRSFRVLGGHSRPARRTQLSAPVRYSAATVLAALVAVSLGVPVFGSVSASLINGLGSLVGDHVWTLDSYRRVLASAALRGPLVYSAEMATVTATITLALAVVSARLLAAKVGTLSSRVLDLMLLTAVALPGIVFAAGYIFTYNLPLTNSLGIHLYETTTLLVLGYLATALPSTSRVLLGSVSQVQESLQHAARVHGLGRIASWTKAVLPVLARPMLAAWVLTFAGTLLELPVSQLLYPPDHPPVAIGIEKALANYDYSGGTAMEVVAVLLAMTVLVLAWALFALLAPVGWRRLGRTS